MTASGHITLTDKINGGRDDGVAAMLMAVTAAEMRPVPLRGYSSVIGGTLPVVPNIPGGL